MVQQQQRHGTLHLHLYEDHAWPDLTEEPIARESRNTGWTDHSALIDRGRRGGNVLAIQSLVVGALLFSLLTSSEIHPMLASLSVEAT